MKARKYLLAGKRKPEQDLFFKQALDALGWKQGDEQDWDTCWFTGMPDASEFKAVGPGRSINHIPGNNALTIKSRLFESVSRMRDRVSEQFGSGHANVSRLDFLPRVYSMPRDYHLLQQAALDDPCRRWILKPKNASRGRGIRVVSDIASVPMESSWMVQQYLANPHIMRQRKYVLRLYVLVSSIDPLRVYLHRQGFAKLASAPYDVNDADNPFSQLTNPDINALNGGVEVPVEFVDLERYRAWLREEGHDDERLFAQIRDLVTLTVISAVGSMRRQSADCGADTRGCYELLGLDCLIDDQLKPWILECNLSPSLGVCAAPDGGADIEERVKAEVVSDTVGLVGMDIARQPHSVDGDRAGQIRLQAGQEQSRAGGFERLWPNGNPEHYLPYFALPRLADMMLADACSAARLARPRLVPRAAEEVIVEDRVGLYDERSGRLDWLNESASFIWLMAMQGADPDAIADRLHQATTASGSIALPDLWTVRKDVWDCLADWAESGKIMQRAPVDDGGTQAVVPAIASAQESFAISLRCGACSLDVHTGSRPVSARIESGLGLLRSESAGRDSPQLQVVCDTPGYTLVLDDIVIASRITLAALVPAIAERLVRMAAGDDEFSVDVGFLGGLKSCGIPGGLAMVRSAEGDAFALNVAARLQQVFSRGIRLDARRPDRAVPLGLPGRSGTDIVPASPDSGSRAEAVDAVILCRNGARPNAGAISAISAREALADLLPLCSTGGRPIDASTLLALFEWLGHRRLYALDTSDHEAAFQALHQSLYEPLVACAPAQCDSIRDTQESTA